MFAVAPFPIATFADCFTLDLLITLPFTFEPFSLIEPMLACAPFPIATFADCFTLDLLMTLPFTVDPANATDALNTKIPAVNNTFFIFSSILFFCMSNSAPVFKFCMPLCMHVGFILNTAGFSLIVLPAAVIFFEFISRFLIVKIFSFIYLILELIIARCTFRVKVIFTLNLW